MAIKIRIKIGQIEIEYEGEEQYLKDELPGLLKKVSELFSTTGALEKHEGDESVSTEKLLKLTIKNMAAKLKCTSGKDLVLAAIAHLSFAKGLETFERKEILAEMKKASSYYQKSYGDNLTSYLTQLVKDEKLIEPSTNNFALKAEAGKKLREAVAR